MCKRGEETCLFFGASISRLLTNCGGLIYTKYILRGNYERARNDEIGGNVG